MAEQKGTENRIVRMSWPEIRDALREPTVLVVPIGSVEQHGPYLPVGTDYLAAQEMGERLAGSCSGCLVAPAIPYAYAENHLEFSGTMSVRSHRVLVDWMLDILSGMVSSGARHILFINTHGGNIPALSSVCRELRKGGVLAGIVQWWDVVAKRCPELSPTGHADWTEAALVMDIDESWVDLEGAQPPRLRSLPDSEIQLVSTSKMAFRGVEVGVHLRVNDFSATGDMVSPGIARGDADPTFLHYATTEKGDRIYSAVIEFMCEFIPEFSSLQLPAPECGEGADD